MTFEDAIGFVLEKEGGFTLNQKDAGNWTGGQVGKGLLKGTKYGISAASYPDEDIRNLTLDRVRYLYRRDFWNKIKADSLPKTIRLHVFDFAVNAGVYSATKRLQESAGVTADGEIGPKTIAAAESVTPWRFAEVRAKYYVGLANSNANHRMFLAGWMLRNLDITRICIEYSSLT